ncbi:uncharacterized protein [Diadema antillarum]|uniref:uncharacterized protein n=1 Tax=Diadema antillarum TaxID=105358 RepID=UPI003A8BDF29
MYRDTPDRIVNVVKEFEDITASLIPECISILNEQNILGQTPLHAAVILGSYNCGNILLENRSDPNIKDNYGNTPLQAGIKLRGDVDFLLGAANLDVTSHNMDGFNAIHQAVVYNRLRTAGLLLDRFPSLISSRCLEFQDTTLHIAAAQNFAQMLEVLLKYLIDTYKTRRVESEYDAFLVLLVKHGGKIDAKDINGETPLDNIKKEELKNLLRELQDGQSIQPTRNMSCRPKRQLGKRSKKDDTDSDMEDTNLGLPIGATSAPPAAGTEPTAPDAVLTTATLAAYLKEASRKFEHMIQNAVDWLLESIKMVERAVEFEGQRVDDLEKKLEKMECDMEKMRGEIARHNAEANKAERFSRRNNFSIVGIEEAAKDECEDCVDIVEKVIKQHFNMDVKVEPAHRDGKRGEKPRHILVKVSLLDDSHVFQHPNPDDEVQVFHNAIASADHSCVFRMLRENPDIIRVKYEEQTALFRAVVENEPKIVKALVKAKADVTQRSGVQQQTVLHTATKLKFEDIITFLIPECTSILNEQDINGRTPLHVAVMGGSTNCGKILLENRSDPNIQNNFGDTPLQAGIECGKDVDFLIGAPNLDVTSRSMSGFNAIHLAVRENRLRTARLLLDRFPSLISTRSRHHLQTPLHLASTKNLDQMLDVLLNRPGVDVNALNSVIETPLHCAAEAGATECVELLLSHGADIDAKTGNGETPLHMAAKMDPNEVSVSCTHTLTELINTYDKRGVESEFDAFLVLLVKKGGKVDVEDVYGKTPLDYVKKEELENILQELQIEQC